MGFIDSAGVYTL